MKKKVFHQLGIGIIITQLVFLSFICFLMYCEIFIFEKIGGRILTALIIILILLEIFSIAKHRIVINDSEIFTPGQWRDKSSKIQYKTKVRCEDIVRFRIITSARNSRNEKLYSVGRMPNMIKVYLEFTLKSGKTERIYIDHFTKKQWAKIIDEIKLRIANIGNNIAVEDTMEMINGVDTKTIFYYE